ncbi:MAG TPA: histidine phosphatase family protein [Thermoanaerobaculia bacterium]|nr:histidine phosphatase family protein [Thermoanaerobaculia bacterium]
MIERIILVRHGQTVHNVAGIAQGWSDSDLSELGREQVQALARRVALLRPTALYSSPLGRALSTAEVIREATGLEIIANEDFREMNYGRWEGCSFLEVRQTDEEIYRRWIVDGEMPCPEGESHMDVQRRMLRGIASVTTERPLIVSHGTALRIAATALLGLPVTHARQFAQENASINVFARREDRWILRHWNDVGHWKTKEQT